MKLILDYLIGVGVGLTIEFILWLLRKWLNTKNKKK